MKGTLIKTQQGWAVNYHYSVNKNDWEQLPLHPDDIADTFKNDAITLFEGKEVDFKIVTLDNGAMSFTESFQSKQYAKLIRQNWSSLHT